jgi:hypothetical protein
VSERATEFVAQTLDDWDDLRVAINATKPDGVRCYVCERESSDLAGTGPLRNLMGVFICPICEAMPI